MDKIEAVIDALRRAPEIVVPLVREVPPEILMRRPEPGRWSAHEHACHLPAVQPLMLARLDLMLKKSHPRITAYDPGTDDADDALLAVDLDEAMERLVDGRKGLVSRLRGLAPDHWRRTADHPEYNQYSVFVMFRHLALHDLTHAYRIEELLLKPDWE